MRSQTDELHTAKMAEGTSHLIMSSTASNIVIGLAGMIVEIACL